MKTALMLCAAQLFASAASADDLEATLSKHGQFGRLLAAFDHAGLAKLLRQPGPYTIFAPTDAAFAALSPERAERLSKPVRRGDLERLLGYHVVVGTVGAGDWRERRISVRSMAGMPLMIEGERGRVSVNDARASHTDIGADNGVIHVIDRVLTPPVPFTPRT